MAGDGWIWLLAAVVLGIGEVLLPGYVLLGFAIGAGAMGVVLMAGGPLAAFLAGSVPALALGFALVSLGAWMALRRWAGGRAARGKRIDYDVNEKLPGDQENGGESGEGR
ncbi:NfeD family protein [Poseidonocella sp. HB161398]|uniref:NfeD family protein n=1 Tax=Poseidonocella sp. HB161398 TaxID=2320855 RepID=UPI001108BBDD|nr:hypothetical protein [Poseidonocella sp. HB161398]